MADAQQQEERFTFTGNTSEYFGIWFVNGLLVMITLGIYSPWAKVRKISYFYSNTSLAGSAFQFLASPMSIFVSRMIAGVLLIVFVTSSYLFDYIETAAYIYIGMVAIYLLIAPILLVFSMSFRLRNSAWRGIRFRFRKDFKWAYRVYLAPLLLLALIIIAFVAPIMMHDQATDSSESGYEQTLDDSDASATEQLDSEYYLEANESPTSSLEDRYDENSEDESDLYAEDDSEAQYADEDTATDDEYSYSEDEYNEEYYEEDEDQEPPIDKRLFIPALILAILFILLLPYFDFISTRFLAHNSRFGTAKVNLLTTAKGYYIAYGKWLAATVLLCITWYLVIIMPTDPDNKSLLIPFLITMTILYIPATRAYLVAQRYNLLFGNMEIGNGHRLHSNVRFLSYFWIMITNSIGNTFTLGLLTPWTHVRTATYFLDRTYVVANGSLEDFAAGEEEKISALGEEISDVFDLEVEL